LRNPNHGCHVHRTITNGAFSAKTQQLNQPENTYQKESKVERIQSNDLKIEGESLDKKSNSIPATTLKSKSTRVGLSSRDALDRKEYFKSFQRYSKYNRTGQRAGLHDPVLRKYLHDIVTGLPRVREVAAIRYPVRPDQDPGNLLPLAQSINASGEWEHSPRYGTFCFVKLDRTKPALVPKQNWNKMLAMVNRDHFMLVYDGRAKCSRLIG
jgi:hypothetical protein